MILFPASTMAAADFAAVMALASRVYRKIILNNECLFCTNARSISNYKNEVYNFGKLKTMDEALNYVLEILKDKDYTISYK